MAVLAAALLLTVFAMAALPARAQSQSVNIAGLAFAPASVTVSQGSTVTWTNNDAGIPHTVSADGGTFDSGNLTTGQTFSQTFSTAGSFPYHCNIHPQMTGTVTVTGAGGGATTTPASGTTPAAGTQQPQQQGTAAAPAVGSGLAGESNGDEWPLAVLAGGLAMVVAATAYTVLAARRR
jgi:plastocyanin